MFRAFKDFLLDDSGAVTVDSVVVMGGSVWMAVVMIGDISTATMSVSDNISDRLEYASIIEEILGSASEPGMSEGDAVDCVGNPGNDKCVGNAGETPNGDEDGWGDGTVGRSDG